MKLQNKSQVLKQQCFSIISVVFALLVLSFALVRVVIGARAGTIRSLEAQIARMEETIVPVRFKVTARTQNSISADLRFYDLSGNTVGKRSVTVRGQELHIDVAAYSVAEHSWLFFPYAVFSDEIAPADGVLLSDAYDDEGFPLLYAKLPAQKKQAAADEAFKESLTAVFSVVKGDAAAENERLLQENQAFGSAVHDIKELSGFKVGVVYRILCHPHTGGAEIVLD